MSPHSSVSLPAPAPLTASLRRVFDPPEENPVQKLTRSVVPNGKKTKDQVFAFDRVFDDNVSQSEVYESTTRNLLDSVLEGYNATVFAYGATGCGKTHTITGTTQMPGIIFLTMQELFEKIADRQDEKHTEITLSYLEIYNETIRDLLVPGGSKQGLMLREDANQAVTVSGLTSYHPKDVQEVMDMIVRGNEYRTVSPTEANATSSRSHAVLQINVAQKDKDAAVNEPHTMATLSIIDLAGSERASATKNRGERLLEGANINKSLLALGSCINALCDPGKKNHVPYRNSKLTRLLKFSLGGNCKTVMIVCVSPSSAHFDETQNTLRYANRAKNIQTKVTKNVFNVNRHVKDFLVKIDEQMNLIKDLKAQQKDAEAKFYAKFQKQADKNSATAKEGIQRIRIAYENSAAERNDKVNHMKKQRSIERRISLLSSWIAAFDTICDAKEDENCLPSSLTTMRKTAQGILLELETSRQHIHQKLEKTNWERAIDSALQHSIGQLPAGAGTTPTSEVASLQREAELLKSNFAREAYRDVLEQDKAGDAGMMQVLLTAQFEMMASLSEALAMDEEEAVAHATGLISRLLSTGCTAASQVVKPDGAQVPVEKFSPSKRGTPKRKKAANAMIESVKPIPMPAFTAALAPEPSQLQLSPMKGSPRRRKASNVGRKSVSFTPVKKKSPSKRAVRWRDDETEGTLADFEKTPQKYDISPEGSPTRRSPRRSPRFRPAPKPDDDDEFSPPLVVPEISVSATKPNRFQAGFLSKARSSMGGPGTGSASSSPSTNTTSLNQAPSGDGQTDSPLRSLDVARTSNLISPPARGRQHSLSPQPRQPSGSLIPSPGSMKPSPSQIPSPAVVNENHAPGNSESESETSQLIDTSKLRSALHARKRGDRLSSFGSNLGSARRVSSIGSIPGSVMPKPLGVPLASATNGISRRRASTERRKSPPMACSPPDASFGAKDRSFTAGQARRMGITAGIRERMDSSPNESLVDYLGGGREMKSMAGVDGKKHSRRITIGGAGMMGSAAARKERGIIWR